MPSGEDVMQLDLGEPPEDVLEYARTVFGEYPETRDQVIDEFRDMIFDKEECYPHRTDDAFLLRFLRARNFNIPKAHRLLVRYYSFKEKNPDIHKDVRTDELRSIGENHIIAVPPYRDQNGRRLMIYRIGQWNPSESPVEDLFKASIILLELGILEQRAQILGGVCIFDLEGLSLQHAWCMTPSIAAKLIEFLVASFPMKIQAIHIVNQSWVFDIVYAIFRPLLDERMRQRIFFHGNDLDSLHNHIDTKYLPERYGGIRPDFDYSEWLDWFRKTPVIIEELQSLGYIVEENEDLNSDDEILYDCE